MTRCMYFSFCFKQGTEVLELTKSTWDGNTTLSLRGPYTFQATRERAMYAKADVCESQRSYRLP